MDGYWDLGGVREDFRQIDNWMKVLILHQFANHSDLVNALFENLNKNNIEADSFNIANWNHQSLENKLPFRFILLSKILVSYKLKLFVFKYAPKLFLRVFKNYDIVDIHFFSSFYFKAIDVLKVQNKKIKITVWGSDFYRSSPKFREIQRMSYNKIDCIQVATAQMKKDFINYYNDFEEKINLAHFGISNFESIADIESRETNEEIRKRFDLPNDRLIVTCGYNGSKGQQHMLILQALEKLNKEHKNQIFLLLPMTYGADPTALETIKTYLKSIRIPYCILLDTLSSLDVCRLRLVTDIALNVQVTDAFSASIQEHIKARNIVLVGDWLPYNKFDEYNIFYFKSDINNFYMSIEDILCNYEVYREEASNNFYKIEKITSWDNSIINWIKIYQSLYN